MPATDLSFVRQYTPVRPHNSFVTPGYAPHPKIISDLSYFSWFSYLLHKVGSYGGSVPNLQNLGLDHISIHAPFAKDRAVDIEDIPTFFLLAKFNAAKQKLLYDGWRIGTVFTGVTGCSHKKKDDVVKDNEIGFSLLHEGNSLYSPVAVIVFRGSKVGKHGLGPDWSIDFDGNCERLSSLFSDLSMHHMTLHRGFAERYYVIQHQLEIFVNECLHKYPNIKFIVTGHSMGAAMAQIAAWNIARLISNFRIYYSLSSFDNIAENKIWAFLISSPKIFNNSAAYAFNRTIGIYNTIWLQGKHDIVPRFSNLYRSTLRISTRRKAVGIICEDNYHSIKERASVYHHQTDPLTLSHYVLKTTQLEDSGFIPGIIPSDLTDLIRKGHLY